MGTGSWGVQVVPMSQPGSFSEGGKSIRGRRDGVVTIQRLEEARKDLLLEPPQRMSAASTLILLPEDCLWDAGLQKHKRIKF